MSAHVCKVCKEEISDFILCRGNCRQYLHYSCANIAEDRVRSMSNKIKRKWKCNDCRVQKGHNSLETENLDSENDSGNSLSSDIGSVQDGLNSRNGELSNTVDELDALRQELAQTVQSLEKLRAEYNATAIQVADIKEQMTVQETNLNKVSVEVRDINKNLDQNVRNKRLEIHGLVLGGILALDYPEFNDKVKEKVVEVGERFGVELYVKDIDKVDIWKTKKNPQRPILLVHFFSKVVRDKLIAARKNRVINADLKPKSTDQTRIYINENICSYYKSLWYEARRRKIKFVWVREGKVFVKKDPESRKKRITCMEDLDKLEAE